MSQIVLPRFQNHPDVIPFVPVAIRCKPLNDLRDLNMIISPVLTSSSTLLIWTSHRIYQSMSIWMIGHKSCGNLTCAIVTCGLERMTVQCTLQYATKKDKTSTRCEAHSWSSSCFTYFSSCRLRWSRKVISRTFENVFRGNGRGLTALLFCEVDPRFDHNR